MMMSLKDGGLREMGFLKKRMGRAYGRNEIDVEAFERLTEKLEDLMAELEALPKTEFCEED